MNRFERPEVVPTKEQVWAIFEQVLSGKEYEIVRELEDDKGIYLWEIVVAGEDGDTEEYTYLRQGEFPEGNPQSTTISVGFIDSDGMVTGGEQIAKCIEGKLKLTP